ncbi:UNVERIFIED_CONTAM: Retrovirus-related Pol polyprotein from transposon TNT 1-94 [Sesamum indicum]
MLIRMEKQLQMNMSGLEMNSGAAFQVKTQNFKKKSLVDKKHIFCEHCQRLGHSKDTCFKLHGVPDWYKEMLDQKKKTGGRGRDFIVAAASEQGSVKSEGISNITDIIRTEMKRMIHDKMPLDPLKVNFAQLDNFAAFSVNLLSFRQLCQAMPIEFLFLKSHCILQDLRSKRIMATGELIENLYVLSSVSRSNFSVPISIDCNADSYAAVALNNDDFSRSTWIFFMRYKSQCLEMFQNVYKLVFTQFNKRIQSLRTDNGSEFLSSQFQSFLRDSGIVHQRSCAYTPQQNGVVERKCRFLLDITRSIMFQSSFPRHFWGDAILSATYLINRFPTAVLGWKSPYEILYNEPPSYTHLKTIGCLCFAIKSNPNQSKFDKRASKCVLLGYPPGQKAYRLLDLDSNTIFVSRNITFHEDVFPFAQSPSTVPAVPLAAIPLDADTDTVVPSPHLPPTTSASSPTSDIASPSFVPALETNNTWEVVPLPYGKRPIECRWVYKIKLRDDGSIERYKARLVAKEYTQVEGVDYVDRFSPVAKAVTVRLFIAIAIAFQWPLHQIDINNAFLHGHLDEEIYMDAPEGYSVTPGHVCLLRRSLYSLKQASRQWNLEFSRSLIAYGFKQSEHDHCLFLKPLVSGFTGLLVYVDDMLIMAPTDDLISQVKLHLDALFTIKDLGCARYFLGLQIARSVDGTSLTQSKYISDIISDCGLLQARPAATPL